MCGTKSMQILTVEQKVLKRKSAKTKKMLAL